MTYKGHVENGVVVFDEPFSLADGTPVSIEVAEDSTESGAFAGTLYAVYEDLIGALDGMPEDLSANLDQYLEDQYRQ